MRQTAPELTEYRHRLDNAVTDFSLFIRDLCPEAQLEITLTRYEDEDAHIRVSLPATLTVEEREALANRFAEKSIDFLLTESLLIMAGVEEA